MPRHDPAAFDGLDCVRVYIAAGLAESQRAERILDDQGIDYFIQVEEFQKLLLGIIPRDYAGAAFYVRAGDAENSRRALLQARLRGGLQFDEPADTRDSDSES